MSTAATVRPGQRVDLTLIVDAAYGLGRLSTREHVERRALAAKAPARVSRVRPHTLGDAAFVEVFTDQGTYTLPAGLSIDGCAPDRPTTREVADRAREVLDLVRDAAEAGGPLDFTELRRNTPAEQRVVLDAALDHLTRSGQVVVAHGVTTAATLPLDDTHRTDRTGAKQ